MPNTKTWLAKLLEVCLAASTPLLEGYVPTKRDVDEFLAENERQGRRNRTLERATFYKVVKVENSHTHLYAGRGVGIKSFRVCEPVRRRASFAQCEAIGMTKVKFHCPSLCVALYVEEIFQFLVSLFHCLFHLLILFVITG